MSVAIRTQPELTDSDLMASIADADGDLHALGLLFDRYHADLRRFLRRLQVPAHEIDDLVQVTFLEIPRAAARFDRGRPLKAWLFGLATMVVRRHWRSLSRLARKVRALALEPTAPALPTPAELLEHQHDVRRAEEALRRLAPKKQVVFVMVVLEHLSGEAVAQALGIPVATVWTRLHHARRELRALLAEGES